MTKLGQESTAGLAAPLLLCLCFGAIHAYGVLTLPLERELGSGRALASLGYSVAIVMLTAGVFATPYFARRIPARYLAVAACLTSSGGLILASAFTSIATVLIGYGLFFGFANGIAYSLALTASASALPQRPALGMGLATAAYGIGAMVFAMIAAALVADHGPRTVFATLAALTGLCAAASLVLPLPSANAAGDSGIRSVTVSTRTVLALWTYYLLVALSSLMIIAHAPAIAADGGNSNSGLVASLVSGGSVVGGALGGSLVGRWPGWQSLSVPALLQALALAALAASPQSALILAALTLSGLCYGIIIAAIPGYMRMTLGADGFARAYGPVFTAWGLAGFAGPVLAGTLHDLSGSYAAALVASALLSAAGAAIPKLTFSRSASPAAFRSPG